MLEEIVTRRGKPLAIRCDNGPELTSRHFLAWCVERQIELVHIQPGKPIQNARVESFHGRMREECLNVSWFENLFEARRKIAAWRKHTAVRNRFTRADMTAEVEDGDVANLPNRVIHPHGSTLAAPAAFLGLVEEGVTQPGGMPLIAALDAAALKPVCRSFIPVEGPARPR